MKIAMAAQNTLSKTYIPISSGVAAPPVTDMADPDPASSRCCD